MPYGDKKSEVNKYVPMKTVNQLVCRRACKFMCVLRVEPAPGKEAGGNEVTEE